MMRSRLSSTPVGSINGSSASDPSMSTGTETGGGEVNLLADQTGRERDEREERQQHEVEGDESLARSDNLAVPPPMRQPDRARSWRGSALGRRSTAGSP
jgi:hypothetical protein